MAAMMFSWTTVYCSGVMPSEACLCEMRESITSARSSGFSSSMPANAAMEPARARCCSPLAWFPRLNRFRSRSGWASKSLR